MFNGPIGQGPMVTLDCIRFKPTSFYHWIAAPNVTFSPIYPTTLQLVYKNVVPRYPSAATCPTRTLFTIPALNLRSLLIEAISSTRCHTPSPQICTAPSMLLSHLIAPGRQLAGIDRTANGLLQPQQRLLASFVPVHQQNSGRTTRQMPVITLKAASLARLPCVTQNTL